MAIALTFSRANCGVEAPLISVETHLSNGLPAFTIVGLPEAAVKESRDRVRSAIINSHFTFPARRITVNLAPAELPKEGSRFDLAIALGILLASEQLQCDHLRRRLELAPRAHGDAVDAAERRHPLAQRRDEDLAADDQRRGHGDRRAHGDGTAPWSA